ncbi:MAG: rhodanese-like domain-containing protein [Pirellula sp.]|jgi:rhodanese-related sulfurtransferase
MKTIFLSIVLGFSLFQTVLADQRTCGVEAAFGAVHAIGIEPSVRFEELLTTEYVSHRGGSTADDVCKAVRKLGARGTYLQGMGSVSLLGTKHPLILHVYSDGQLQSPNHWLLFLGMEDGLAKVVDGGGVQEKWPLERLLARWPGRAIVVSPSESNQYFASTLTFLEAGSFVAIIVLAFVIGKSSLKLTWKSEWLRFLLASTGIVAAVGVFSSWVSAGKLPLPFNASTRYIFAALDGAPCEYVDLKEFLLAIKSESDSKSDTVVVDCRYESDTKRFPVPGTIPVSLDEKTASIARSMEFINRDRTILLFCLSERCRFSEVMAIRLTGLGFHKFKIFRGGYEEWLKSADSTAGS